MTTYAFDQAAFLTQFPEFAANTGPLPGFWTMATQYISPTDGYLLNGPVLDLALNLMTAHLAKSYMLINAGQTTAVVQGATEGSVTVTLTPPPVKTAFGWWLQTTVYGQQLRALLSVKSAGGLLVGGSMERQAFRKAGGVF